MLNQPLRSSVRALAIVSLLAAPAAAADPHHPSIHESARNAAVRMATADAKTSVLPPNYPLTFAGPVPTSRAGRQIVAGTAGAIGGLFAGALIGTTVSHASGCNGECSMTAFFVGAPIGAVGGAIAGALLAR